MSKQPKRPLEVITLREHAKDFNGVAVRTHRYEQGYVTRVVHHRTKKWHATKDLPQMKNGWPDKSAIGPGHSTKQEAIDALG